MQSNHVIVVGLLHLKNIKMPCKIQKNSKNGKINGVLNQEGEESTLFQQIFNTPTLSLTEAIEVYKNIYSDKFKSAEVEVIEEETLEPIEVQVSKANVELIKPSFLTASQMAKAVSSERMLEIKQKQEDIKKKFEELEKLNNCLWN